MNDKLLTIKGASALANVSTVTMWRWLKEGKLTRVFVDGRPFVRRADLEKVLAARAKAKP